MRQHRRGLFVGTDVVLLLGNDRAGVHLGHREEDRHADGLITGLQRSLHGARAAPPWEQAGVDVQRAILRHSQEAFGEVLAIRGRDAKVRPHVVLQSIQKVLVLGLVGAEHRYVQLLRNQSNGAGYFLASTFASLRRLRDHPDYLEGTCRVALRSVVDGLEGGSGHLGRAEENDARLLAGCIVGAGAGM